MFGMFRSLWQYRQFVFSSVQNELRSRFARSKLGGLWMIMNPLFQVAIYALILSNILQSKLPETNDKYAYPVYLMAGLLGWSLFSEIISRSTTLFIDNGNLMKKMNFPRVSLPSILVSSCLLNNVLFFIALLAIFVLIGHPLSLAMLGLIPLTLILIIFALGLGLIISIFNVFLRDINQIMPMLLQVWFWFTPIVYPDKIIPAQFRYLLNFNPMYPIINAYHQILVYNQLPSLAHVMPVISISLILLGLGFFLFRQASSEMVDVL